MREDARGHLVGSQRVLDPKKIRQGQGVDKENLFLPSISASTEK